MRTIERAYAKINWSLDVLGKREDGYHELDMLITTIALSDELSFESADDLTLAVNGRSVPRDGRNLVIRAAEALIEHTGKRRGAHILLNKRIPIRAGLGGGSADCAATLRALNRLWRLNMPLRDLTRIGARLGSDVPVLMGTGLTRVRGVGDRLLRLQSIKRVPLVLLHPSMGLSTPSVFGQWDQMARAPLGIDTDAAQAALVKGDMASFYALSGNALEESAIHLCGDVRTAREALIAAGARFAQMSGSGSAVYGAFDDWEKAKQAKAQLGWRAILTSTYP